MDNFTATKKLGIETVQELDAYGEEDLKRVIVQAETAKKQVKEELARNPAYEAMCLQKRDMEAGKREVFARQNAKVQYSLHRLGELGKI
jgi:hypothetical protein